MGIQYHIKHDSGETEVVAGRQANTWLEPYHSTYPFWPAMAQDGVFDKDFSCRHINYPHYAFEFVLEGELRVVKGDTSLLLTAGEATVLVAGNDSSLQTGKCGFCHKASCTFTGELVHAIFSAFRLIEPEKILIENTEEILVQIRRLIPLLKNRVPGSEPEICGIGYQLLNLIARSVPHGESLLFERARRFLTLNIAGEEDISDIVRRLNTTAGTLERLFRSHLGTTPRAYLTGLRMQTAAELLRNSTLRIGQIAERVGYGDPLAFSHAFRRVHGTSPRAFRKSQQMLPPARDA